MMSIETANNEVCPNCGAELGGQTPTQLDYKEWDAGPLLAAGTRRIGIEYFEIQRFKQDKQFRERTYCYELYHQMRCFAGTEFGCNDLLLMGELDKVSHHDFSTTRIHGAKPDFVFHHPGVPDKNHTVIEVKLTVTKPETWVEDLATLDGFMDAPDYSFGVLLLVGPEDDETLKACITNALKGQNERQNAKYKKAESNRLEKWQKKTGKKKAEYLAWERPVDYQSWNRNIQIWHHAEPGKAATQIATLGDLIK